MLEKIVAFVTKRSKNFPPPLRKTRSRLFLSFPTDTLPFVILSKHGVAVRIEGSLKTILEKGKTALLPFSPYSEELHAERVKPPRVYQSRAPKGAAARENRTQSVA